MKQRYGVAGWVLAVLALALVLLPGAGAAQAPEPAVRTSGERLSQLALDVWDDTHGLPQNSVQAMAQTADGYLWVGTQVGLARFDGVRFTLFDDRTEPKIASPYVWSLAADPAGGLYVGTEVGGLQHLKDGRVRAWGEAEGLPSEWVYRLHHDSRGALWIGTIGGGLARLRDGVITVFDSTHGITAKNIVAITEDSRGSIWVAAPGQGLLRLDGDTVAAVLTVANGLPGGAGALSRAAGGGVWVGTGRGLALVRGDSVAEIYTTADGLLSNMITALSDERDGALWIATDSGMARLSGGRIAAAPMPELGMTIGALEIDQEGSVWIGTYGNGLARVRATPFTPIGPPEGLSSDVSLAIRQDRAGGMWIGSMGGGVDRIHDGVVTPHTVASGALPDNTVFSLTEAPDGSMWVGTTGGVAVLRNGRSQQFGTADGVASPLVRAIAIDDDDAVWFATSEGLQRFRPGPPQLFTTADGLPDNFILTVVPARAGGLWIGTRAGVTRYLDGRFTTFGAEQGLDVAVVTEQADGTLWLGGGEGLARMRGDTVRTVSSVDGLCDDAIMSIVLDTSDRLWMGGNRGIFMLTPAEFDAFAAGSSEAVPCRLYGRAHGMRSRETNGAVNPAAWRASDGRIWFPTLEGVVIVDPDNIDSGLPAPRVVIEAFVTEDARFAVLPAELPAGTRALDIEFTALTFVSPGLVRFRYRMDGVDDDWREADEHRVAAYTNLGPGRYSFRVIAANADGVWNEAGAVHAFTILPLWWETWWFRGAAMLAVLGLLFYLYRARVEALKERQRELLALVEERSRAEARYRELFENAADAVFTTDLEGRFTALNRRAELLTGYSRDDAPGLNVRALLPANADGEHVARHWLAGRADGTRTIEIHARDGTRIPVEVSTRIIHDGGQPVGVQALARDVRDRAALEGQLRQSQKMQAVGQLAAGVAHDFNNLLTVIRGNGEILLGDRRLDMEARVDLEQIVGAAKRASALTRQLLAFSRTQVVQPTVIELNHLIQRLDRMLRRLIGEDVTIVLNLSERPCFIVADPGQIEQVLVNLAVNARDAMPQGGTLTISTALAEVEDVPHAPVTAASGLCAILAVSDTGTGMDAATQARIFEPFYTTKAAGRGTGLGLSTVYGIVGQAGGQIICQSQPGHGTTFRIYLPITAERPGASAAAMQSEPRRGTETVLLVEDDSAVRSLARRLLVRLGYNVLETGDGAAALRIADEHPEPIHLLLTDMVMPNMNGREVAARMIERRPDLRVLLMSGYTDDEILRRGLHDDRICFLQKPFTVDDLGRAVRSALDSDHAGTAP